MSTQPTKAYLLARIAELQRQVESLPAENRWGDDSDYAIGEILMWRRTYGPQSRRRNEYEFVAIKRKNNHWQLISGTSVNWSTLVAEYLNKADDGQVFCAVRFDNI